MNEGPTQRRRVEKLGTWSWEHGRLQEEFMRTCGMGEIFMWSR